MCKPFGLLAILLIAAAPSDKEKQPEYYPLKEGNKWHYKISVEGVPSKTLVVQVAKMEKINDEMLARVEALVDGKVTASEHLAASDKGVFRHRFNGSEATPPFCVIKLPFKKGDEWKSECKIGDEKVTANSKASEEEIEVPAGKFKAISIESETTTGAVKVLTTLWFADGVGMVKQTMNLGGKTITLELEKFEKGKEK
jgi:hypothetical protein